MIPPPSPTPSEALARAWGDAVRHHRAERTQRWLATVTGYDQTTISRIEAGKARFTPEMLLRLAVALDQQLEELFAFPAGLVDAERRRRAATRSSLPC